MADNSVANVSMDLDDFIGIAGFYRQDGKVVGPDDDFEFEQVAFDPDQAQIFRCKHPDAQIWTMVSGDGGDYLTAGTYFVNRLCYLFTDIKSTDPRLACFDVGDTIQVPWYVPEEEESAL